MRPKKVRDALLLEVRLVVSHLTWVLGMKPGSSRRAVHTLNH